MLGVNGQPKIRSIIFSDLGQAASFMALDWVKEALQQSLGFVPYPATLNLRPKTSEDAEMWQLIQREIRGIDVSPAAGGFCKARLFAVEVEVEKTGGGARQRSRGAVLLPDVRGYPKDKIEVVAPVRLKDQLGLRDGDQLALEFIL
jgi:riboflavin kinase